MDELKIPELEPKLQVITPELKPEEVKPEDKIKELTEIALSQEFFSNPIRFNSTIFNILNSLLESQKKIEDKLHLAIARLTLIEELAK